MFSGGERTFLGIIVFVYFVFLIILSLYINRKTKTYDEYNVAGRSVSIFPLVLTFIGTGVGGATLLGYMENGYVLGMGQQWIHITMFISVIFVALFLVKRIRALGEKYDMVTISDYTTLRYGEKARIPTFLSVLCSYCTKTGMQFVAIATILNLTIGIDMTVGILIGWALLTFKTYFGGLKSVIWQDVIHGTILTLGVILTFFTVLIVSGGWGAISESAIASNQGEMLNVLNIKPQEILIFFFTLAVHQFVRQDLWQRIWAAKSLKTAVNGYWVSMIIAVLIGALVVAIGVFSRFGLELENVKSELIFYSVIDDVFPFSLVVVMIIVLLAAVISSADSFFIAASSSVVNDVIKPNLKQLNDRKMLFYSRISVLIVSFMSLVLALLIPGLVNLLITGTAMAVSGLLAPVIFGMFWKRVPNIAGLTSMWIGLGTAITWQVLGHPFGIHPIFIGLPSSIIALLIVTFFTRSQDAIHSNAKA